MQPQKPKRIHVILLIILLAAEAVFIILYAGARTSEGTALLAELYVAGILICGILLAFMLLTRVGPSLLLKSAKSRLQALKAVSSETGDIEPDGIKESLSTSLQNKGFSLTEAQLSQSGDTLRVLVASGKAFSLFTDRLFRYMLITEDFHKARDFDTLRHYVQTLIDAEELTDEARARSGFAAVVVLLMEHVPAQLQTAAREEACVEDPAYIPVACDMSTGKAYYMAGTSLTLPEFRCAQRMIKKHLLLAKKQ